MQSEKSNIFEQFHNSNNKANSSKAKSRPSKSSKSTTNIAMLELLEEKRKASRLYFEEKQKLINAMNDTSSESSDADIEVNDELNQQSKSDWARTHHKFQAILLSMINVKQYLLNVTNTGILSKRANVSCDVNNTSRVSLLLLSTQFVAF